MSSSRDGIVALTIRPIHIIGCRYDTVITITCFRRSHSLLLDIGISLCRTVRPYCLYQMILVIVFENKRSLNIRFRIVFLLFQRFQFLGQSAHIRFHTGDIMVVPDKINCAVRIFKQTSVDVREDGFLFVAFDILVRSFRFSGLTAQNKRTSPACRLIHAGNDKPVLRAFDIMHFRSPHCMKAVVHRITVDGFFLIFLSCFIYFRLLLPGAVFFHRPDLSHSFPRLHIFGTPQVQTVIPVPAMFLSRKMTIGGRGSSCDIIITVRSQRSPGVPHPIIKCRLYRFRNT